jgi:hypothetical protein
VIANAVAEVLLAEQVICGRAVRLVDSVLPARVRMGFASFDFDKTPFSAAKAQGALSTASSTHTDIRSKAAFAILRYRT